MSHFTPDGNEFRNPRWLSSRTPRGKTRIQELLNVVPLAISQGWVAREQSAPSSWHSKILRATISKTFPSEDQTCLFNSSFSESLIIGSVRQNAWSLCLQTLTPVRAFRRLLLLWPMAENLNKGRETRDTHIQPIIATTQVRAGKVQPVTGICFRGEFLQIFRF